MAQRRNPFEGIMNAQQEQPMGMREPPAMTMPEFTGAPPVADPAGRGRELPRDIGIGSEQPRQTPPPPDVRVRAPEVPRPPTPQPEPTSQPESPTQATPARPNEPTPVASLPPAPATSFAPMPADMDTSELTMPSMQAPNVGLRGAGSQQYDQGSTSQLFGGAGGLLGGGLGVSQGEGNQTDITQLLMALLRGQ